MTSALVCRMTPPNWMPHWRAFSDTYSITIFKKKTHGGSDFHTHHRSAMLTSTLPAWRSKFVVIGVTAVFLALGRRPRAVGAGHLDHEFYLGEGQKRYQPLALSATRGKIVDRNDAMLAVNLATYQVWATPRLSSMAITTTRSPVYLTCRPRTCKSASTRASASCCSSVRWKRRRPNASRRSAVRA